jgi:hypothetical protein
LIEKLMMVNERFVERSLHRNEHLSDIVNYLEKVQ